MDFILESRKAESNLKPGRSGSAVDGIRGTYSGADAETFCRSYDVRLSFTMAFSDHEAKEANRICVAHFITSSLVVTISVVAHIQIMDNCQAQILCFGLVFKT